LVSIHCEIDNIQKQYSQIEEDLDDKVLMFHPESFCFRETQHLTIWEKYWF